MITALVKGFIVGLGAFFDPLSQNIIAPSSALFKSPDVVV